jgi:hypothetical protein
VDVRGLVVSVRTGEPVPAARLWLDSGTDLLRLADVARSAEDGTFRIEARVGDLLWVAAAGYVPWSGVVSASEDSPLVAALEEGAGIQGVVVTEDDQPVKGARVSVRHVSNRFAWPLTEWVLPGTVDPGGGWAETDAEGRFRVGGLREGPVYQVDVQLAGHVVCRDYGNWRRILVQPSQEDVWIVMHPVAVVDVLFRMPEDCVLPYDVDTDWPPSVAAVVSGRRSEALRAGRLPVQEEVSADLRLTTWLARGPLWQDGARPSVFHRVHGPGVKEASLRLPVVFGETRSGVIAVEPEAGETSTVRFLARFHSGSPYTGALWLTSRKITQGKRGYAECLLDFREGVATKPVRLVPPTGKFAVSGCELS